jgi:predicted transcriptional regulator
MSGMEFRKWRRDNEISQQRIANLCDVHKGTICNWEKGKTKIGSKIDEDIVKIMAYIEENKKREGIEKCLEQLKIIII